MGRKVTWPLPATATKQPQDDHSPDVLRESLSVRFGD
jgi:hypothetical protein